MRHHLRRVLLPFLATRLALLVVGWLSVHLLASGLTLQKGNLVFHQPGTPALEIWARWDAEWYLLIAERGYGADDAFVGRPVAYAPGDDAGFFPLYPMLIRAGMTSGLSPLAAGVLVSNLALLLGMALLRDLAQRDFGEAAADRTVWIFLAFPTAFFLSAVYAESIMLAMLLGAVRMARDRRPVAAGLMGALCALSRPTGILVILPLGLELWNGGKDATSPARRASPALAAVGLSGAGLAAYMLFCRSRFGAWAPFLARQERWRGATSGPWKAFLRYFEAPQIHGAHHSTIDLVVALALVAAIPWMFLRLRRSDALYGTAAILLPLGSTLWSFTRFAAVIYPFPLLLGAAATTERRQAAWAALLFPIQGLFMALYASWWWVG
jgi:hypothetical protein